MGVSGCSILIGADWDLAPSLDNIERGQRQLGPASWRLMLEYGCLWLFSVDMHVVMLDGQSGDSIARDSVWLVAVWQILDSSAKLETVR